MDIGFLIFSSEKYRQRYRHFSKCPDQPRARLLILRISASSALSALVSQASVRPLSGVATPGQARTRASSPQKPQIALLSFCGHSLVGAMPAAGYLLETLGNLAETRWSPRASVSAAICCALLHSEPTISKIRAVFVACRTTGSVRTALRTFSIGLP